ncbi:MAG: preprotein translocase subunit SecA, partial [Planctomycetota bacterium]
QRRSEELVIQALVAREMYKKDKQYVTEDEKIVIVDEFTGRLMPDRTWRDGLHQAVEAKEGLEVQPPKATLARISFQRFFRMYRKLSGMTGTAWESRHEVWQTYKTPVVRLKTHRPCIRTKSKDRVFAKSGDRWASVVGEIKQLHETGRPVLIGTRSVGASEKLSELLAIEGLEHMVLNAVRHAEEAQIVAGAGQEGQITIATNMAGRGTDIKLGRGVADLGGLAVISAERNDSGRIDRQLYGRAGRQGDPGSAGAIISCEDELIVRYGGWSKALLRMLAAGHGGTSGMTARWLVGRAQRKAQRMARRQRIGVLRTDDWLDENLAFAGSEV